MGSRAEVCQTQTVPTRVIQRVTPSRRAEVIQEATETSVELTRQESLAHLDSKVNHQEVRSSSMIKST